MPKDKIKHFLVSMSLVIIFAMLMPMLIAIVSTLGMGVLKEALDNSQSPNKFDWMDILADIAGILIGIGLLTWI